MDNTKIYLAIIAGGQGTRLFPLSHDGRPKQFCQLNKEETFIQASIKRFIKAGIDPINIVIVTTNNNQTKLATEQAAPLGVITPNILQIEPTFGYAGAMIQAAKYIYELDEEAIIVNTPADQHIITDENFIQAIDEATESASEGHPTIVGVKITDMVTVMGCGHACYDTADDGVCKSVTGFVEKPGEEEAKKLLRTGNSVVNTGINVWGAEMLLEAMGDALDRAVDTDELMKRLEENLKVTIGSFRWFDCGTLSSFYDISTKTPNHKNASLGGVVKRYNCRNSLFITIPGVEIHASNIKDSAIVVNEIDGRIVVACVKLSESQKVRYLAEDFKSNRNILLGHFSLDAKNNRVANTALAGESSVGFIGEENFTVTILKVEEDSNNTRIIVSVTDDRNN